MNLDLNLLERWLTGWSMSRGLPLPIHQGGGLMVDVGLPDQMRRHVFADAGRELQECAAQIHAPFIFVKAPVDTAQLRQALPSQWVVESPHYLMYRAAAMPGPIAPPPGFIASAGVEHGAHIVRLLDTTGETAALGRVALNRGTAVFDRIETMESYRRKGLATALMYALDTLAEQAGATERLLVATEAGRALYTSLGWDVLAPYSTAGLLPS